MYFLTMKAFYILLLLTLIGIVFAKSVCIYQYIIRIHHKLVHNNFKEILLKTVFIITINLTKENNVTKSIYKNIFHINKKNLEK